jgi:hypothetical protein
MPLADIIQRIVHFLDVGKGPKLFRGILVTLFILAIVVWYDAHNFKNFSTPDAMDPAQLARNIAAGRGYTTDFIRPLSIYLVSKWNIANRAGQPPASGAGVALLQKHPDLENPPVYPLFLAGLMKVAPFHYVMEFTKPFWSSGNRFARYEPDFLIALADQLLMLVVVTQMFFIARKLFDLEVACVTAMLVFGCEAFWKLSLAGLPTMLVIIIFLGLTRVLVAFEEAVRAPTLSPHKLLALAAAAGVVAGVGGLTLYSFGWVIVPVVVFIAIFGGPGSGRYGLATMGGFVVMLGPWVVRNYLASGTPFGTAGFAAMAETYEFPGFRLEQALHPDLTLGWLITPYVHKLLPNLTDILQNQLPRLGHSWVVMLFLAGLLLAFRGLAVRRLRYFLLLCLAMFLLVQPLARTGTADLSPEINSENLLVIFLPLILMYGTVFFFTFLDQIEVPVMLHPNQFRHGLVAVFVAVMCLPFLGDLAYGSGTPLAYPPYYPPEIQMSSAWLRPDELEMSDVPWAVAWYGHRQCVWLTRNIGDDFYELNDYIKPVRALYLTPVTLDKKLFTDCVRDAPTAWNNFALKEVTGGVTPAFPLRLSPGPKIINSGLYLTDRPRWLELLQ